jgi:hypothetical protein
MSIRIDDLLTRLSRLARHALFGTLSETYRTCGKPGCRCHAGDKHGPHLYISFRGNDGKTTGYYVPQSLAEDVRAGVTAWRDLQDLLKELAEVNRKRLWQTRASRESERG